MSISISSTTGFANNSPSQSFSVSPNQGGAAAASQQFNGTVPVGAAGAPSAASFKKTFAVSSLKSLNRRQNYVLVLEFEKNLVSFHKVRRGKEVKRSFPFSACVKLERDAKHACQLTTTFGHEPRYKKALFFANPEERELFCNLVHAMIVSGSRAVKLFKSIQIGAAAAAANGSINEDGMNAEAVQGMDFCDFLISFSSAQTQLSHNAAMGNNNSGSAKQSSGGSSGGMTFDEEAELVAGGRARANASDPQAAILAFLSENSNANGGADGAASGINGLASSNLVSLLNGRLLEGETPINSSEHTYRVECSCGGIGHTVLFKRSRDSGNHASDGTNSISPALAAATAGGNQVETSAKEGTGISASSRGLFLLTNYRILYVNYNENNNLAAQEAAFNYQTYMPAAQAQKQLLDASTSALQKVAENSNVQLLPQALLNTLSPSAASAASSTVSNGGQCSCDGDFPLGFVNRVSKSGSKTSEGCEMKIYLKDGRKIEFGFDCATKWVDGLIANIQKMAFPKDQNKLFAFSYTYNPATAHGIRHLNTPSQGLSPFAHLVQQQINGWDIYDPLADYTRIGLAVDPQYRVVLMNTDFSLCASYPKFLIEPACMRDEEIKQIAQYRSQSRLPAVVWIHPITRASLSRCAQPLVGLKQKRSELDEKLVSVLRNINPSNQNVLHIFDARPWKAAMGNTAMGKGYENMAHYENATLTFMNIDNIHQIRSSLNKLMEVCAYNDETSTNSTAGYLNTTTTKSSSTTSAFITNDSSASAAFNESFLSKLESTLWLHYVRLVLSAAQKIAVAMSEEGASCITHCSDGWDRTSQLAALTELMLDPYYRTMEGFAALIEKEWLSFGHRFAERHGHGSAEYDDDQRAPIFLQFLDCVYQLLHQFPNSFEFNEDFLIAIHDHVFSHRFGTFLFNCASEREKNELPKRTVSLWTFLLHSAIRTKFTNGAYIHPPHVRRWNLHDVEENQKHFQAMCDKAKQHNAASAASINGSSNAPPAHSTLSVPGGVNNQPLTSSPAAAVIASYFCIPSVSAKRIVLWEKMHLRNEREYLRTRTHAQIQIGQRVNQAVVTKHVQDAVKVLDSQAANGVATASSSSSSSVSAASASAGASSPSSADEVADAWIARYNLLKSRIQEAGLDFDKLEAGLLPKGVSAASPTNAAPRPASSLPSPIEITTVPAAATPVKLPPALVSPTGASSAVSNLTASIAAASVSSPAKRKSLNTSQLVTLKATIDENALHQGRNSLKSNSSSLLSNGSGGDTKPMPKRAPPVAPSSLSSSQQPMSIPIHPSPLAAGSLSTISNSQQALFHEDHESEIGTGAQHMSYASDSDDSD